MSKFVDWTAEIEAQGIAQKLQEKFPTIFGTHDLTKISWMKMKKKSADCCKIIKTGFPFDAFANYVYYVLVYEGIWSTLSLEQKVATVFEQLIAMEPDGFDGESNNYAKLRKKDVNEYSELLCAVQLNINWKKAGASVPNLLDIDTTEIDKKEEAKSE
jgi:hypothetical protein